MNQTMLKQWGWFLMGIGLISLIMSYLHPSCFLCDLERYLTLSTALILLFSAYKTALFSASCLLSISLYHIALQYNFLANWIKTPAVCTISKIGNKRVSCGDKTIQLFTIPLPVYVALLALLTIILILYLKNRENKSEI